MKCISKLKFFILTGVILSGCLTGCSTTEKVKDYEQKQYNTSVYTGELYATDLCVSSKDVKNSDFEKDSTLHASALFDLKNKKVVFSDQLHEKLYPASTTKILTALVAIKKCKMDEVVTITKDAAASSFGIDDQVCGLKEGDQITMEALLNGLLLHSGNDNAVAIAEYVGGDIKGFSKLMNEEAKSLFATNTHFVSPNGLHDDDHYTTAYDLYLIFSECIKHQEFLDIIKADSYEASITGEDGTIRKVVWEPTSYYARGEVDLPTGAKILGGKTGYTGEAGNCLILLSYDDDKNPYISIVMGADTKPLLYEDMTDIINLIPEL